MLTRRYFLQTSMLAGVGLLAGTARPAGSTEPPLTKSTSSLLRQNHRPFSPKRVVIMTQARDGGVPSNNLLHCCAGLEVLLEKLELIVRLTQIIAGHYRVPFEPWAIGLARREALGTAPIGLGCSLVHQFQDATPLRLVNPPADWWLFLFPAGACWESPDGRPVFGMIGHVFPSDHWKMPGLKLRTWALTTRLGWLVGQDESMGWERISRLDQERAASELNRAAARCVAEL